MMFEAVGPSVPITQGKAFVHQTAAIVYAAPSTESDTVVRLSEGMPVEILSVPIEGQARWLSVRTSSGQLGFLRANTHLTTREQLLDKRAALQRGLKLGRSQLAIGSIVCLFGCAATVFAFVYTFSIYVFYGAIMVGGGQLLWGLEQVANSRRSLKQFDVLWKEAMA
jgi:hypothetical protein